MSTKFQAIEIIFACPFGQKTEGVALYIKQNERSILSDNILSQK